MDLWVVLISITVAPTFTWEDVVHLTGDLTALLHALDWKASDSHMQLSIENSKHLGADVSAVEFEELEERLIAHISMADDQSASHR